VVVIATVGEVMSPGTFGITGADEPPPELLTMMTGYNGGGGDAGVMKVLSPEKKLSLESSEPATM